MVSESAIAAQHHSPARKTIFTVCDTFFLRLPVKKYSSVQLLYRSLGSGAWKLRFLFIALTRTKGLAAGSRDQLAL